MVVACTHQREQPGAQILQFFSCFNKTIIPLALVGYEIIIASSALRATLAIY